VTEQTSETLTFLFTDVESSTELLRQLGGRYPVAIERQQELLRDAFAAHRGVVVDTQGDAFFVAFARPRNAVLAAVAAQKSLRSEPWPDGAEVRVRMGIHTGPVELAGDRYVGLAVHRAARICAAGHGGQVLLSEATRAMLEDDEHELRELRLRDLGSHRLKDFHRPIRIFQLVAAQLPEDFPALRAPKQTASALETEVGARASDAERDQTVSVLREHAAAGRLTLEEFSERTERVYAARTTGELELLGADLPATPEERARPRPKRLTLAVLGNTQRTGRWRLPRFSTGLVLLGDADLDLRQAELEGGVASITVWVLFGNVDLYVPEGVEVDLGGVSIFGHRREWGRDVPPLPGTPLVRIRIFSLFGTADLWRVPAAWIGRSFGQVIKALRRDAEPELPAGPGGS
jgi:class 3 adenylate cyclase